MTGWVAKLAGAVGAQESALRLVMGQMAGYPLFLLYRKFLMKSDPSLQHFYFLLTGLFMSWWAIGESAVFHSSLCILVTWLTLKTLGNGLTTALLLFAFNIGYLFVGYLLTASSEYDIIWTMPGCVICLRLIGLAIDVYDGGRPQEELSVNEKANALKQVPTLLECFSHSFFIGGYFVGPQFCMRKFQAFVERNRGTELDELPSPVGYGFKRLGIGIIYMLVHLVGSGYVPESWVRTDEFVQLGFLARSFWLAIWLKVILCKYIAAWLIAEGSCVVSGLAFNGVDSETKQVMWNGIANVRLRRFETAGMVDHLIRSFNINTNAWVAHYIYKRLKFLNNRIVSQIGVLFFLAVWHGYHSGYFLVFFNEFIILGIEKEMMSVFQNSPIIQRTFVHHPFGQHAAKVIGYLYIMLMLPHSFLPFALLKSSKYMKPIAATGYFFYVAIGVAHILKIPLKAVLLPTKTEKKEK